MNLNADTYTSPSSPKRTIVESTFHYPPLLEVSKRGRQFYVIGRMIWKIKQTYLKTFLWKNRCKISRFLKDMPFWMNIEMQLIIFFCLTNFRKRYNSFLFVPYCCNIIEENASSISKLLSSVQFHIVKLQSGQCFKRSWVNLVFNWLGLIPTSFKVLLTKVPVMSKPYIYRIK